MQIFILTLLSCDYKRPVLFFSIFIMLYCILQSDKDLVQEVTRLRRSLDDAECLSLDTKKEWAFLRTENISLKERDVSRGKL